MEIKFADVSCNNLDYKLNFAIKPKQITGVYGSNYLYLIKLLLLNINDYSGNILVNGKDLKEEDKKKFCYLAKNPYFLTETVSDEFYLIKKDIKISANKYIDKIVSSLNMVGLSKDYLERKINTLSKSEKKLIQIALGLISNPELIIFENTLNSLDGNNTLRIKKLVEELKNDYEKIIIFIDKDINNLYELSNQVIILDNTFLVGTNKEIFNNIDYFIDNKLEIPSIIRFINESKKYNIDLSYSKNIKDLGKEVVKYVKENKK